MFSRITYLVAFAVIMVVNCDASYRLEYSKPATLDCSSLAGKVSFYERDSSKTKPEDFRLIINPNITAVKTADKTTDKTADKTADKEQQLPRLVNEEKKTLTFSVLTKEDLDKSYMCKNEESVNKTFHLHPQFIPDSKFKSNVSILASSFRLVVSLQVKNVNCTWHVKRADQNNSEHTIVDSDKYKVYAYQTDNTTQVWLNDLHINKPGPEDTGVYVCELKNEHGFALRVVDIKVQSEIMALWPFLIVLAQVLLCSGMFFIWEKRCARQDNSNEYSFEQAYMNKQRQNQMA